jgi:hypothetical protein
MPARAWLLRRQGGASANGGAARSAAQPRGGVPRPRPLPATPAPRPPRPLPQRCSLQGLQSAHRMAASLSAGVMASPGRCVEVGVGGAAAPGREPPFAATGRVLRAPRNSEPNARAAAEAKITTRPSVWYVGCALNGERGRFILWGARVVPETPQRAVKAPEVGQGCNVSSPFLPPPPPSSRRPPPHRPPPRRASHAFVSMPRGRSDAGRGRPCTGARMPDGREQG